MAEGVSGERVFRASPYRMLWFFSPILLFFVVPRVVFGDPVFGRTCWEIFGLCVVVFPFVMVPFGWTVVGERGVTVRRAFRTRHLDWDDIGAVELRSHSLHLLLVLTGRDTGRAETVLTFVQKAERRLLVETIVSRVPPEAVRTDELLLRVLGREAA